MSKTNRSFRRATRALARTAASLALVAPATAAASQARERAIEEIPELMGRILESQEQIRERESEMVPLLEQYAESLDQAKQGIQSASSETEAAEALVDYVETYAQRLETQEAGLRDIEGAVVRMRADARELARVAEVAGEGREPPEQRHQLFQDQFQGVALATRELATRLQREDEAATSGAVLRASWPSHATLNLPMERLGPESALAFARKLEGLYARLRAHSNQLRGERRAVRRLLDLLIERQLSHRLDSLFAGTDSVGLGLLLSPEGKSRDWQDLNSVVSRTLGLPTGGGGAPRDTASLDQLDYFIRGGHRD